jgi:hypothetical protein
MSTVKAVNLQHPNSSNINMVLDQYGAVSGGLPYPNRNIIYNGAMQVAQRGTSSTGITSDGYYTADRWRYSAATAGTWTQSIENDGPTGSGFTKSLKMLCTTAKPSLSTSNECSIAQILEGQDLQRIRKGTASAQQLTLSFWVKSNITGTFVVWLYDSDNSRQVSLSYNIVSSATWEYKTLVFPSDLTGAFANDNGESLVMRFYLAAASDLTAGTLQTTWASVSNANRCTGQVNLAASTNNYWQITGVQLELGTIPTSFEFKTYAQELRECQRYFIVLGRGENRMLCQAAGFGTTDAYGTYVLPVTMRTAPTLVQTTGTNYYAFNRAGASVQFNSFAGSLTDTWEQSLRLDAGTLTANHTAGVCGWFKTFNVNSFVAVSAEL